MMQESNANSNVKHNFCWPNRTLVKENRINETCVTYPSCDTSETCLIAK